MLWLIVLALFLWYSIPKLIKLIGWLINESLAEVPAAHYGLIMRRGKRMGSKHMGAIVLLQKCLSFTGWFGKREGGVLYEGTHLKWPSLETRELVPMKLMTLPVLVHLTTRDELQLEIHGSLQYRADPTIEDGDDQNTFYEVDEDTLKTGTADKIEEKVGALGGLYDKDSFINGRQALGAIINCALRLEVPPHLRHDSSACEAQNCNFPEKVEAGQLIGFYNKHWPQVKDILDHEKDPANKNKRSELEKKYGIEVETFALAKIDFTGKTKDAMEQKVQLAASREAFDEELGMIDRLRRRGVESQLAINAVQTHTGQAERRQVISVEGNGQAVVFAGMNPFGQGANRTSDFKKKKGKKDKDKKEEEE